jgi:hypothetical protein
MSRARSWSRPSSFVRGRRASVESTAANRGRCPVRRAGRETRRMAGRGLAEIALIPTGRGGRSRSSSGGRSRMSHGRSSGGGSESCIRGSSGRKPERSPGRSAPSWPENRCVERSGSGPGSWFGSRSGGRSRMRPRSSSESSSRSRRGGGRACDPWAWNA